jgi:hypothetical protein
MSTAVAKGMSRTLVKGFAALLVVLMSGLVPAGMAMAADLAFPIQIIPVYSQDENIFGVFTDTRVIVFNPSTHCPGGGAAFDPDCIGGLAGLPKGTELEMFWFDADEDLVAINSRSMTPFASVTITSPTIPPGTGTAIFVNIFSGVALPIIAFFHPISAVVEIGIKPAPGPIDDGSVGAAALGALVASEAQVIPALAGEFPRVEITAGPGGSPQPFPVAGWETVIAETCLIGGVLQNFFVTQTEVFLGDIIIPCTGLFTDTGPDLALFTPDDGGLLGTLATPLPGGALVAGYNRMAIDVNTLGPIAGATFFYGQAFVIYPGGINRQAYSYNMHANYFYPYTALQRPVATGSAVVTDGVTNGLNIVGIAACKLLEELLGQTVAVSTNSTDFTTGPPFNIIGAALCDAWFGVPTLPE